MDSAIAASTTRWELYRLLGEPVRLRLLALAAEEELAIGELAELLREGQPNVSRHVAPLKKAGLLVVRKHGTRVLARLSETAERDPVVQDGVRAGRELCEADGSLLRVAEVVAERDESAREFFGEPRAAADPAELPSELPAYLTALASPARAPQACGRRRHRAGRRARRAGAGLRASGGDRSRTSATAAERAAHGRARLRQREPGVRRVRQRRGPRSGAGARRR